MIILLLSACSVGLHLHKVYTPYTWLHNDGAFYFTVAEHLLESGQLDQHENQPRSWYQQELGWNRELDAAWSNLALGADGHSWYPKHGLFLPVLALPFLFALGPLGSLVLNLLLLLSLPLLSMRLARTLAGPRAALLAGAVVALTPAVIQLSWSFGTDVLQASLLLYAACLLLESRASASGLIFGIAVFAKLTSIVYLPGFAMVYLLRRDWRGALRFGIACGPGLLLFGGVNWLMFGDPLTTGYQRTLVRVGGTLDLANHSNDFASLLGLGPRLLGLFRGAASPLRSMPYLVLAPLGLGLLLLRRKWAEAAMLLCAVSLPLFFFALYRWNRLELMLPALLFAAVLVVLPLGGRHPQSTLEDPPRPPLWPVTLRSSHGWVAVSLLSLLALLGVGGTRRLFARTQTQDRLSDHLRAAKVSLGTIPCDYFNPQVWRWECAHFDRGQAPLMTGALLTMPRRLSAHHDRALLLAPHPSARPRRIEFALPPLSQCSLQGLWVEPVGDAALHTASTLTVSADHSPLLQHRFERRGDEASAGSNPKHPTSPSIPIRLPLPAGAQSLSFELLGPRGPALAFDAHLRCASGPRP